MLHDHAAAAPTPALLAAGCIVAAAFSSAAASAQQEGPADWAQPAPDEYVDTDPSALTDFRPALDPHGTWVADPTYGTAWTPDPSEVGAGFQPYDTAGQWDYASGEYSWVSDYAWGWVCFHYGRWAWSAGRWLWIPGREYAAAWVEWRIGDEGYAYVGWEPMPPSWVWAGATPVALDVAPPEPWAFAGWGDLFGPGLSSRVATGSAAAPALGHSRPYVRAQPGVGAPSRRALVHGPPLASLGLDAAQIARPADNARELRARQLARPSSAVALGAHAPAATVVRPVPRHAAPVVMPRAGGGNEPRGHGRR
jgi:hypothetical protein